jgi:hypothetical protein
MLKALCQRKVIPISVWCVQFPETLSPNSDWHKDILYLFSWIYIFFHDRVLWILVRMYRGLHVDCTWTDHGHSNEHYPVLLQYRRCDHILKSEAIRPCMLLPSVRRVLYIEYVSRFRYVLFFRSLLAFHLSMFMNFFIRRVRKTCEKRLSASSCLGCPSGRMEQLDSEWKDFYEIWYLSIFLKLIEKI